MKVEHPGDDRRDGRASPFTIDYPSNYHTLMTTKQIKKALKDGHVVRLGNDMASTLCFDLFGDLVVVSRHAGVPTRKATLADRRKAVIHHLNP